MAMMEHECTGQGCTWATFNNNPRYPDPCPRCGYPVQSYADESPDDYGESYFDDDEPEDDECSAID